MNFELNISSEIFIPILEGRKKCLFDYDELIWGIDGSMMKEEDCINLNETKDGVKSGRVLKVKITSLEYDMEENCIVSIEVIDGEKI